ncbi:MAG: hypothetical protein AAF564_11600 [Bacteroidota bacterium]
MIASACDQNAIPVIEMQASVEDFPYLGESPVPTISSTDSKKTFKAPPFEIENHLGSYNLTQAEHDRLYALMKDYQGATGERYVGFLSTKSGEGEAYFYRYRSFFVPKWLEEKAKGEIMPYVYVLKRNRLSSPQSIFFAFIPRDPNAILMIREWIATLDGRLVDHRGFKRNKEILSSSAILNLSSSDCTPDEQIVYYEECDCYGYADLPICAYGGGGDDPIFFDEGDGWDDWEDPGDDCGVFGCDDNGGGSGNGSGDGSGFTDEEYVEKYELTSKMQACGIYDDKKQSDIFDGMFRKYTSINEPISKLEQNDPTNPYDREFDGVRRDSNGDIYLIYEGKFSESVSAFKRSQSEDHLNILEGFWSNYDGGLQVGGPHYLTASLAQHNADISFTSYPLNNLLPISIAKRISWVHYTFKKSSDGDYFFERKYMTPLYITAPNGTTIPVPLQLLSDLSGSVLFRLDDCSAISSLLTHP